MNADLKYKLAVRAVAASVGLVLGILIDGEDVATRCVFGVGGIAAFWFTSCVWPGFAADPAEDSRSISVNVHTDAPLTDKRTMEELGRALTEQVRRELWRGKEPPERQQ